MKYGGKTLIWLLCLAALQSKAVVNDIVPVATENNGGSPYSAIWLRNVFDLKPPPAVVDVPKTNTPPPNVQLTGITTFGVTKALFMVKEQGSPGKPANKEESYILQVNQRQGQLEVLDINVAAKTVKIDLAGTVSTITFETNKSSGGSGSGAGRGAQPPPSGFNPAPVASYGNAAIPARDLRSNFPQPQNNYSQPGSGYTPQNNYGSANGVGLGGGGLYNQTQNNQAQANPPPMTAEEQAVAMAANRQVHAAEIANGTYPPFPSIPGFDPPSIPGANTSTTGSGTGAASTPFPQFPGSRSSGTLRAPPSLP